MIEGLFEILMLLCFAAAWPFSIYRLWTSKSTGGKSVKFSYIVMVGYLFGIANKIVTGNINYVMFFYLLDLGLVLFDTLLYYRNLRYETQNANKMNNADEISGATPSETL